MRREFLREALAAVWERESRAGEASSEAFIREDPRSWWFGLRLWHWERDQVQRGALRAWLLEALWLVGV